MTELLSRLLVDEDGQDLIEYAFLTVAIGLAAIAVFDQIGTAIRNTYGSWESNVDNLWVPPGPAGGGS
jgi:Flp pilus assembly pilin Flp